MAKLTISDITSGYASTTALNTAFTAIETALENTLSRDGTSPNQMNANLDMNGYAILNQRATSGANFVWMGTWTPGITYAVNNLVYAGEGTNLGNTLICVTANTAGATLNGDAAKWAIFAQRGATGAGTGDVVGPASSTVDYLAQWSDVTGTTLKNGVPIGSGGVQAYSINLDALSSLTTGTSSGNIPLVGTSSATDVLAGLVELATTAEAAAGTDTARAVTPAGGAAAIAALGLGGSAQSWSLVTGSRALGGAGYTNSTGKPIQVFVTAAATSNNSILKATVGGVNIGNSPQATVSTVTTSINFIVPPGATYIVSVSAGSFTLSSWAELS